MLARRLAILLVAAAPALLASPLAFQASTAAQTVEEAVTLIETRRDYSAAARLLEKVGEPADRALAARALLYLGTCYERLRDERARQVYARLVEQYADQGSAAARATERLAALTSPNFASTAVRYARPLTVAPSGAIGRTSFGGLHVPNRFPDGSIKLRNTSTGEFGESFFVESGSSTLPPCTMVDPQVLSPDDKEIAYGCRFKDGSPFEIRAARLRSGLPAPPRRLIALAPGEIAEIVEWRVRDMLLAQVLHGPHGPRLLTISTNGNGASFTKPLPAVAGMASMSLDGKWLVFDTPGPGLDNREVHIAATTPGSQPYALVAEPFSDRFPIWAPDDSGIVFVSNRTGVNALWFQRVVNGRASGPSQEIYPDIGRIVVPLVLSRTGQYSYFRETGLVDVQLVDVDDTGLLNGRPRNVSTERVGQNLMPAWSPDGEAIAYLTREGGLTIRWLAAKREQSIHTGLENNSYPRWAPDGRTIVLRGHYADARTGLFLIDVQSGGITPLKVVPPGGNVLGLTRWEHNGNALLTSVDGRLVRIDVETKEESTVYSPPQGYAASMPDISATSGGIVFVQSAADGTPALMVRNTSGDVREVRRFAADERVYTPIWLQGDRVIIFGREARNRTPPERAALFSLDLATGDTRRLDIDLYDPRDPAISPDGKTLAFTVGRPTREVWILENFLPKTNSR